MPNPSIAKPVVTRCRHHLRDTVAGIGTLAGYHIDVGAVATADSQPTPVQLYACRLVSRGETVLTEGHAVGHTETQWNWSLIVDVFKPASVTDVDVEELFELTFCDVVRAVLEDRYRGGDALDTEVEGWDPRDGQDDGEGIEVRGFCKIRYLIGRPNKQ